MKYLIVNADDYNLTEGVSKGIIASAGIVTSTTCMTNMPDFEKNLLLLNKCNISPGIHFNLTCGRPLSNPEKIPALIDNQGNFMKNLSIFDNKDISSQVFLEIDSQYNKFINSGITPGHFDSHHHVHGRPGIKDIFIEYAFKKNLPMRSINGIHRDDIIKKGIKTANSFHDGFYGNNVNYDYLRDLLLNLPDGINELMCHPGYSDKALERISSYSHNRQTEISILTDKKIMELIKELNIKLINYRDI